MRRASLPLCLLFLLQTSSALAEVTASGFEVIPLVLSPKGDGAVAEPVSGPSANPQGDVLYTVKENGRDVVYLRYSTGLRPRLLGAGDVLAGSKVSKLITMPTSLDAYRQSLLYTELEDGRVGLLRLVPPAAGLAVTPSSGDGSEPISFHMMGDGFSPGVEVTFGSIKAGFITVLSRNELTGVIPAGSPPGVVEVAVMRPGSARHVLKTGFEFREPVASGCQNLWADHRPPQTSMSISPWAVAFGLVGIRRRRRRER